MYKKKEQDEEFAKSLSFLRLRTLWPFHSVLRVGLYLPFPPTPGLGEEILNTTPVTQVEVETHLGVFTDRCQDRFDSI